MARTKTKLTPLTTSPYLMFDDLMATAVVDSQIQALAESTVEASVLEAAMTEALQAAQQRWGLGLHHLRHGVKLVTEDEQAQVMVCVDDRPLLALREGFAALAEAYAPMRATDEQGLSQWGALPDGHRAAGHLPAAHLKILLEDARDFETLWSSGRQNSFHRLWRKEDTLFIEVARPASPGEALADAAWDVITSIKDRSFQRELMRRSEEMGMLGALLAARHAKAESNLSALPEAHFNVQAVVHTLKGPEARQLEAYKQTLRNALAELEEYQGNITRQLAQVLKHGLRAE